MYNIIKRFFDILLALIVLIVLSPFLIPIIIGLRLTGEGYVFYYQKRIGQNKEYFNMWKFATMLKDSPNIGTGSITLRNDPRVTPMGGFLRKTKINELPQVINVLKGDISIVGPRPLVDKTFNAYSNSVQNKIVRLKPGITGIGSIVFRDEEKLFENRPNGKDAHEFYQEEIAPYKGALEMWYLENQSFMTDLKIILSTAWVILNSSSDIVQKWFKGLPEMKSKT